MKQNLKALILAGSSKLSQDIVATLAKDGIDDCRSASAIVGAVFAKGTPYDLIFLDDDLCRPDPAAAIRLVTGMAGGARLIYITGRTRREDLQAVIAAGVVDHIAKPVDPIAVLQTVRRVMTTQPRRLAVPEEPAAEARPQSRVISVFSALGGVGKTTVALNLAVALPGKKVCIIDGDLHYGDVCRYLDIRPKRTLADMASCSTGRQVGDYATPWRRHADIFACPQTVEEAARVNADAMGNVIKALRAQYETLIVDLPAGFGEVALEVLDLSDRILLIGSAAAIPDIRSTKVAIEILRSLGHAEKVTLVLNRHNARHGIDDRRVEEVLACRFALKLPNDFAAAAQAIRTGVPLAEGQPGKPLSRELARLAQDILSDAAGAAGKPSLTEKISRLFAPRQKSSLNA